MVTGVVGILLLLDAVIRAGWDDMLLVAPWVLLGVWIVYVLLYASHIRADASGATVQNFLRLVRLPWGRVSGIEQSWQIVFVLDDGRRITAFGGPSPARPGRAASQARDSQPRREPPMIRDLVLLRGEWERAREGGARGGEIRRSWDMPAVITITLIVAAAVAAVIITGGPA